MAATDCVKGPSHANSKHEIPMSNFSLFCSLLLLMLPGNSDMLLPEVITLVLNILVFFFNQHIEINSVLDTFCFAQQCRHFPVLSKSTQSEVLKEPDILVICLKWL